MKELIDKLIKDGGCIVSSNDCGTLEIANAQARGDFYSDEKGFGFVRRLPEWLAKHSKYAHNANPDNCEAVIQTETVMKREGGEK